MRVWDVRDGRCLNVSGHNVFGGDMIECCESVNKVKCRFMVFSGRRVHLFDLWRMKVVKMYGDEMRCLCKCENSVFLVLDYKNRVHEIDLRLLNEEKYVDYIEWMMSMNNNK